MRECIEPEIKAEIQDLLTKRPGIVSVQQIFSDCQSQTEMELTVVAVFEEDLSGAEVNQMMSNLWQLIKAGLDNVRFVFIQPVLGVRL